MNLQEIFIVYTDEKHKAASLASLLFYWARRKVKQENNCSQQIYSPPSPLFAGNAVSAEGRECISETSRNSSFACITADAPQKTENGIAQVGPFSICMLNKGKEEM